MADHKNSLSPWQRALHEVIFEADTVAGKAFDVALLIAIVLSVIAVCMESVTSFREQYGALLWVMEWGFTILFTIEYILRLVSVSRPLRYAGSFFGIVDLLAILPTYLSLIFAGTQSLLVIRALRLLRIFRIFKLAQFVGEAAVLRAAVINSVRKIIIFQVVVLTMTLILGAMMFLLERGGEAGFTSIPQSVYWAIVTMTTVGYGDIAPVTVGGKFLASVVMMLGYAIIAVPTGIVTVEMSLASGKRVSTQACLSCSKEGHDPDAKHCKYCGESL